VSILPQSRPVAGPRPPSAPSAPWLSIMGKLYLAEPLPAEDSDVLQLVRLQKHADGECYDVSSHADGLIRCQCGDWVFRREGTTAEPCKHGRALVAAGLMEAPRPVPVPARVCRSCTPAAPSADLCQNSDEGAPDQPLEDSPKAAPADFLENSPGSLCGAYTPAGPGGMTLNPPEGHPDEPPAGPDPDPIRPEDRDWWERVNREAAEDLAGLARAFVAAERAVRAADAECDRIAAERFLGDPSPTQQAWLAEATGHEEASRARGRVYRPLVEAMIAARARVVRVGPALVCSDADLDASRPESRGVNLSLAEGPEILDVAERGPRC
jgi:hypothetical protein